jgi:hypothetical protein
MGSSCWVRVAVIARGTLPHEEEPPWAISLLTSSREYAQELGGSGPARLGRPLDLIFVPSVRPGRGTGGCRGGPGAREEPGRRDDRRFASPSGRPDAPTQDQTLEGTTLGALIMLGTLFGLIVLIFALVLRFDPEARGPSKSSGAR